MQPVWS